MTERDRLSDNGLTSLDDAIAAARAGRREDAARMLRQIVASDPFNADAWVWLGGVAHDPHEQRSALEHALTIAPQHERAQQGLRWLQQRKPELFATPAPPAPTPFQGRGPVETQRAQHEPSRAAIYEVPPRSTAPYDAPTQAMPTTYRHQASPRDAPTYSQTDRMPAINTAPIAPLQTTGVDYTERITVIPPQPEYKIDLVEQRNRGADIARWLVVLTYGFFCGAFATIAALLLVFPASFQEVVNPLLSPVGRYLEPRFVDSTRFNTMLVLGALAVVDLMLMLGLGLRSRWAWWINVVIASVALVGAIVLLVLPTFVPVLIGGFGLTNPLVLTTTGLVIFTAIFWLLSIASYRAFFPRRIEQNYGGE